MHKRLVFNIISRILLIVCFVMMAPLAWAAHDDFHSLEVMAFVFTILFGILCAIIFRGVFHVEPKDYERVNAKDGLAVVGLSWLCLSAFGALPLYLSHVTNSYTDAFFEIASGFTTTGATIFTDIEALPRGILFWRSLTHWLGGMGIIVLYLALLPALGQNAFQLYKAEAPGVTVERLAPRIKETAKILWTVYFLLSIGETVLLMISGLTFFDALCHTFGTVATGGFSTKNASIAAFNPQVQWIITLFMVMAGTNFMLHFQALRGNFLAPFKSEEYRYYIGLIIVLIPVFTFFLLGHPQVTEHPFRDGVFQIVSILTTTGYTTADFNTWPYVLQCVLILLMFLGGCGGSTGGGMKVVRVCLAFKITLRAIQQAVFPNAVVPIRFESTPLTEKLITGVMSYFVIFMLLLFVGGFVFILLEGCDLVTAFSASLASLSNIGPGLGDVGATHNYAWISNPGKWLLTFLMLAGRLELYSILILFLPSTWKK